MIKVDKIDLFKYGIIELYGEITERKASDVCQKIIKANYDKKFKQLKLLINSQGGTVEEGFAIIDMIEWSKIPISTIAIGSIMSMGLVIFMTGKKGKRIISPNLAIMSHKFSSESEGNYANLKEEMKYHDKLHELIVKHYLKYTKLKTKTTIEKHLLKNVDTYVTPKQAIKFGIADKISLRVGLKLAI